MPSPFHPAMDPQIEATGIWGDFHAALIIACRDWLNEHLPPGYAAMSETRVRLTSLREEAEWDAAAPPPTKPQARQPDVAVTRHPAARVAPAGKSSAGGTATLEPVEVELLPDNLFEAEETFVNVVHLPEREVVTSIEVLSPANKNEPQRTEYQQKRWQTRRAGIHLLEIDLLLRGRRLEPEDRMPPGDYFAVLSRAELYPKMLVYAWRRGDPLPTVPVPLRAPDADVGLDLSPLVAGVYDRGRYQALLSYRAAEAQIR